MKTFNIKVILKITLVIICTSFCPSNNKASEALSRFENKSQIKNKVKDSRSIAEDSIHLMNWYDNFSDTLIDLKKLSPSTNGNESLLLTDNVKKKNISSDKVSIEAKPRKLAYVFIELLIKRLSLMLNK